MSTYVCERIWISVDEQRLDSTTTVLLRPHLFFEVGGKEGGRWIMSVLGIYNRFHEAHSPSDIIDAPDSLNNLHPICIEKAFSAGNED